MWLRGVDCVPQRARSYKPPKPQERRGCVLSSPPSLTLMFLQTLILSPLSFTLLLFSFNKYGLFHSLQPLTHQFILSHLPTCVLSLVLSAPSLSLPFLPQIELEQLIYSFCVSDAQAVQNQGLFEYRLNR